MNSLANGFKALVIGSSGAIGQAFIKQLSLNPKCAQVIGVNRQTEPRLDLEQEDSIVQCAHFLSQTHCFDLIIDATGALEIDGKGPEKRLDDLNSHQLIRHFSINAIGPALLMKHFIPLMPISGRAIFATLSARVGSIGDNFKGGWYSYRASKAALNMLLQTAAIEASRKRKEAVFLALQPGTVQSRLSEKFVKAEDALTPDASASMLLQVIDTVPANGRANFIDYRGHVIPW